MNTEILFLVEESQEGGYIAKSIQYSIFTEADTLEELKIMIKDAVECHFEEYDVTRQTGSHIRLTKLLEKRN